MQWESNAVKSQMLGRTVGKKTSKMNKVSWYEPEIECLWDTRAVKATEPELINLSDTEDNSNTKEGNTKPRRTFVSSKRGSDDLCIAKKNDMKYGELEAKSILKLLGHLRTMMTKGQNHDVTLKVKKQEFKAHKDLLCSRSPVFAAMFSHDTEENASGIVSIEDCDPEAFGEFLEFVYTGKVEIKSVKTATALYYIADKYNFEELKGMCVKYLKGNFTITTICDVINMAKIHGDTDLLASAVSFFSRNLEEILISVEWQRFLQMHPTVGNELIIKAVKTGYKKI